VAQRWQWCGGSVPTSIPSGSPVHPTGVGFSCIYPAFSAFLGSLAGEGLWGAAWLLVGLDGRGISSECLDGGT